MDVKSKHTNELLLHRVVEELPPHVVGLMGIHVMDVLAGELSSEQFAELLEAAEHTALTLSGNSTQQPQEEGEEQEGQEPAGPAEAGGTQ